MIKDSSLCPVTGGSGAVTARGQVRVAWVVAGLSLGGCVAFGLMWRNEGRRAAYYQAQVAPLKVEASRYRAGLQEEIARTMRLAEELKAKQTAGVSAR